MKRKQMPIPTAEEKYPELYNIAKKIANTTSFSIFQHVVDIESKMQYKAQCVLEMVIKILESRV